MIGKITIGYWLGLPKASNKETQEEENPTKDGDNGKTWPALPSGAQHIIKQIAAEQILFESLENKLTDPETLDFRLIQSLVVEYPGTCHRQYDFTWSDGNKRRIFPLSMICCLNAPLPTVKSVFTAYPGAIRAVETTRGSLPLHYVAAFDSSMDVVYFVYDKYKEAIRTKRKDGVYPIHLAAMYHRGGSSEKISFFLEEYPEGATKMCGRQPLHNEHSPSRFYWSALHSAANGCVSDEHVLNRLLQLYPESIITRDSHMQTPLHLACENRCGRDISTVIAFLVHAAPEALTMEDQSGLTPLFLAAIYQPASVIRTILDMAPNIPTTDPNTGLTILHWAAAHNDVNVVNFLARRFPEMLTAKTRNEDQDTPLSCACFSNAPLDNIRALIAHNPSALLCTHARGRSLLEAGAEFRVSDEIQLLLEEKLRQYFPSYKAIDEAWPW